MQSLKTFVKSKAFKALVLALAAAITAWASSGCGRGVPKHPAYDVLVCEAAVLEPYLGEAARDIATRTSAGDLNPLVLLSNLGLTPSEIVGVAKRFMACQKPADAPAADGGLTGT